MNLFRNFIFYLGHRKSLIFLEKKGGFILASLIIIDCDLSLVEACIFIALCIFGRKNDEFVLYFKRFVKERIVSIIFE